MNYRDELENEKRQNVEFLEMIMELDQKLKDKDIEIMKLKKHNEIILSVKEQLEDRAELYKSNAIEWKKNYDVLVKARFQ